MAQLAGVTADRNPAGQIIMLHIDVTKNVELVKPFLQTLGFEDDNFDKEFKAGLTREQLMHEHNKFLKTLPWKK